MWPFSKKPKIETREAAGYTSEIIAARAQFFSGSRGVAESTAVVESCVALWERAFSTADVPDRWKSLIDPSTLGMIGRALATRGQFVAAIDSRGSDLQIIPATDFDLSTRNGKAVAYRLSIPEAGGGHAISALADETIDIRINSDPTVPWHGASPLRKARLTADTLAAIEAGLGEVLSGPWGSQVVPTPELTDKQRDRVEERIRAKRGGLALVETVKSLAAGAPPPQGDWSPQNLTADLRGLELPSHWEAVRNSILSAYGIPPLLFGANAQSAALREGQRHAVLWTLAPIAKVASAELGRKLNDAEFKLDLITPLAAADSAGRARAVGILVGTGMALDDALSLVGWTEAT